MASEPERPIERALVVTAHPDDVDFGAAGTIATWTDEGIAVTYCVVTDGDAGGHDPTVDRSEIPAIRRAEQEAAAKEVGVSDVVFLGYPDGQLTVTMNLRWDISRVIRRVKPDRVVCQWPERNWRSVFASHPDHMAAGEATLCAVYPDARNPFAFLDLPGEHEPAHVVNEVWIMSAPNPDTYVDVTDTFDRKVAALRRHVSQVDPDRDVAEFLRGFLGANAKAGGLVEGRLAEAFLRLTTGERRS
jgi:LmbE family N-acetylglucosaminyl deacetylase